VDARGRPAHRDASLAVDIAVGEIAVEEFAEGSQRRSEPVYPAFHTIGFSPYSSPPLPVQFS
jgi:hypothetical protein